MRWIAHRGASLEAPENTMAAFQKAWEAGAHGVELDVHLSADGKLVVIHDDNPIRTTGVEGSIAAMSWPEIAALRARGEPIPFLDEVWSNQPEDSFTLVEIKSGDEIVPVLAQAVQRQSIWPESTGFLCFNHGVLAQLKDVLPEFDCLLNVEPEDVARIDDERMDEMWASGLDGFSLGAGKGLEPELALRLQDEGFRTAVWVIDDEDAARIWAATGVDFLMTNDPRRINPRILQL